MILSMTSKVLAAIGVVVLAAGIGAVGGGEVVSHRSTTTAVEAATTTTSVTDVASSAETATSSTGQPATGKATAGKQVNPDILAGMRQAEASALAGSLHLTTVELSKDRRNGQSIAQIAQAESVPLSSVSSTVLAAAKANLDQAAAMGGITASAEQRLLTRLSAQIQRQLTTVPTRRTTGARATPSATNAPRQQAS